MSGMSNRKSSTHSYIHSQQGAAVTAIFTLHSYMTDCPVIKILVEVGFGDANPSVKNTVVNDIKGGFSTNS